MVLEPNSSGYVYCLAVSIPLSPTGVFMRPRFALIALSLCFVLASAAFAQPKKSKVNNEEADAEAAQQRTVAISLVTSLADEARSFKDQNRRARGEGGA